MEQMWSAIGAVFGSWMNDRAIVYRRQYGIPHEWGTAANICSMVFGNMGDDCATGVAFTRDPATGEKVFYGEYLINAQGEDVVAGIRTPKKIAETAEGHAGGLQAARSTSRNKLEKHYRNVQDIEFTVQKGKLWMLQTRNGKRTGFAAVRFAVDMVEEGLITKEEALSVELHSAGRPEPAVAADLRSGGQEGGEQGGQAAGQGHQRRPRRRHRRSSSSPMTPRRCKHGKHHGKRRTAGSSWSAAKPARKTSAACRRPTASSPPSAAPQSHAALVSRQMGKVCIVGCGDLQIDYDKRHRHRQRQGAQGRRLISIDGFTGEVIAGQVATKPSEVVQVLIDKTLKPEQSRGLSAVRQADGLGRRRPQAAESAPTPTSPTRRPRPSPSAPKGIGLCRTEHMFFDHIEPNARDDPGATRRGPREGAGQAAAVPARATSRASSGR